MHPKDTESQYTVTVSQYTYVCIICGDSNEESPDVREGICANNLTTQMTGWKRGWMGSEEGNAP